MSRPVSRGLSRVAAKCPTVFADRRFAIEPRGKHRRFFLTLLHEELEDRRMLSGSNDTAMLGAITSALSPANSSGLVALGTKLRDTSVLGRELPLIGNAAGTRYDPATALSSVFSQLSGSFTTVGQLATALDSIPGVDVLQSPIDLSSQLELRLRITTNTTISAPLASTFRGIDLDIGGVLAIDMGLDFQISIGAIYTGSNALFYVDATSDQLTIAANITASHINANGRLGFTEVNVSAGNANLTSRFQLDLRDPANVAEGAGRVTLNEIANTSIDNLSSLTTNLSALGDYQRIEQLSSSAVASGISSLATWVGLTASSPTLLGRPMPIAGTQLKDALDLAGLFKSRLVDRVGSFNSAQALQRRLESVEGWRNVATQLVSNELIFHVDMVTSITKGINLDLGLDNLLDIKLDTNSLILRANVSASLDFGIDLTTKTFFLADDSSRPELRIDAAIAVTDWNSGVHVGFLSASARDVAIHWNATASLNAEDPAGDRRISASDVAGVAG